MNPKEIFPKIINRELPSSIVYEDDMHIAILDITPYEKGHTLVIPKKPYENIADMPEEEYVDLQRVVHRLVHHFRKITGLKMSTLVFGEEVPHVHIHIIPITDNLKVFDFSPNAKYQYSSDEEKEEFRKKLKLN